MKSLAIIILSLLISPAYCQTNQLPAEIPDATPWKTLVDQSTTSLLTGPTAVRTLVVGVVRGGRSAVRGYGKVGPNGATPDGGTLFQIASVTKPLTSLLVAQLVVEGKIAYDDVAVTFKDKPVTYRQLVTHTSGLPLLPSGPHSGSLAEFRQFVKDYSLPQEPGSRFEYSVFGFNVLGLCLTDKCAPNAFEASLTTKILAPLKMSSTVFVLPKTNEGRFAGEMLPQPRPNGPNPYNPSGGLISSADDLLRLISANLQPQSQPNLAKALALTQQIPSPEIQTFPMSVSALGWQVMTVGAARFYWATGVGPGRAFITFDPISHDGVVILTSSEMQPADTRMEMAGFSLLGGLANTKLE